MWYYNLAKKNLAYSYVSDALKLPPQSVFEAAKGEYRIQWLDAIHKEVDQLLFFVVLIYADRLEGLGNLK